MKKFFALILSAAILLSSCSIPISNDTQNSPEVPQENQEIAENPPITDLSIAMRVSYELDSLNLMQGQSTATSNVFTNLIDGLLEVDTQGKIQPCLAEKWFTNDYGKTWTFVLRPNLCWVNYLGEKTADCTSADFAESLEWILNYYKNEGKNSSMPIDMIEGAEEYYEFTKNLSEEEAYALESSEGSIFREMVGIETPDEKTIIYHCTAELPYFDSVCTYTCMYPIPHLLVEQLGAENYNAMTYTEMWYNGAYTLTTYVQNNEKVFTKNPNYWDTESSRFNTVTHKMVESDEVAFNLYQAGEIDYVSLTESAVKTIAADKNHPYYQNLAEDIPNASITQFHLNYWKTNDGDVPDMNWNKAVSNKNFRKSIYYGLDLTDYYSRINPVNPLKLEGNTYTCDGFVYLSDGTDYTSLVKEKLQIGEYNGTSMVRNNREKALEHKNKAIDELSVLGVTFPIEAVYYVKAGDQTALDTALVLKDCFEQNLGEEYITLEIRTYISTEEFQSNGRYSFTLSGWNADYGDPQNLLIQEVMDHDNAIFSKYGSRINEVVEEDFNSELVNLFREYTEMVETANSINDNLDKRYKAFAEAEYLLLENCLVIPCQRKMGLCLTKINIYSKPFALFGICNNKMKNWETKSVAYTAEELEILKNS